MEEFSRYVGLDVHKETIAGAIAYPGRSKPESVGVIANTKRSILRLVRRLSPDGEVVGFCYEAGPCGYEIYRWIKETGHACVVVAPSLIPKKPGDRVKTDRRDAVKLASLFRSGELTSVWVPDEEQEAVRDLTRAREEMKRVELQLKQRLGAFLLRHGKRYTAGKSKWTPEVLPLVGGHEDGFSGSADRSGRVLGCGETSGGAGARSEKGAREDPFQLELEAGGGIVDGASWSPAGDRDVAGHRAR